MNWIRFFKRSRWDDERAQELQDYLAHEIDDNIARGMTPDEARRAAHRKLGNPTRIREEIYDMNTVPLLDAAWQDLRYGMRLLLKNPTFSIVAILTLALGTGANAAIFELVNAVRLRTLPVERPQELVSVGVDRHGKGRVGRGFAGRAYHTEPMFQALKAKQQAFADVIAWGSGQWDLETEGEFRLMQGLYASGNFFDALGVTPHAGRFFTAAEDQKGCSPTAVLSYGFWQARYGGNPSVVGQTAMVDRRPFTVVGIAPPGFFGVEVGRSFDVAIPMCAEPLMRGPLSGIGEPMTWWLDVMGRLKPGWTVEGANAHLATLSPDIFKTTVSPRYNPEMAKDYMAFTFTAESAGTGVSSLRSRYATAIWVLLGATGLVLLITCANLANLMLARASARDREIAVRLAIGASRGRVVRQLLAESLLIAGLGAAFGLAVAGWLSEALVRAVSTDSNRLFIDLAPDWRVFAFVAAVAGLACVLFGLSPALKATRTDPGKTLRADGRSATGAPETLAFRRALVMAQVALSTVLIVGALLFARSLHNLSTLDTGFDQDGMLNARIDLRRSSIAADARPQAVEQILQRVRAVPGVGAAAEATISPLSGANWNQRIVVDGVLQNGDVNFNQVGADFFRTLEAPFLAGRLFDSRDRDGAPLVAIVSETLARRYFPGASPVGRSFQMEGTPGRPQPTYQVIGVVKDMKYQELREDSRSVAYLSMTQDLPPLTGVELIVRTQMASASLTPSLTRAIVEAAPGASVSYQTMTARIRDLLVTERLMASLSGFFGILALLIATIGLYGVVSYMVARRKAEIGIRMALGADASTVVRMVLEQTAILLIAGVAIGIVLAAAASRGAATLLYGVQPWDPVSFGSAAAALAVVTLLAAWIPARRASRMAPILALRE